MQGQWHVADFIQKQSAAVRQLNQATGALGPCSGEGAGPVTEQFALDQGFRNGGAVDRHERLPVAPATVVDGAGQDFFPGAGVAQDQQAHIAVTQPLGQPQGAAHGRVVGGQPVQSRYPLLVVGGRGPGRAAWFDQGAEQGGAQGGDPEGAHLVIALLGNAPQVGRVAVEQLRQCSPLRVGQGAAQQRPAGAIGGQHRAVAVHGEQMLAVDLHELPRHIAAEHGVMAVVTQEIGVLDHARIETNQMQREVLAVPARGGIQRGNIQHRQQAPLGIGDRCRGAGKADVGGVEVVLAVAGQGPPFEDAGAHRAGAGVVFVPVRAQVQAGLAQALVVPLVAEKLHGDAALVGEQQYIAEPGDLPIQLFHPGPRHVEELIGALLVLAQNPLGDDARRPGPGRVQAVFLDAALPGSADRVVRRRAVGRVAQNPVYMVALLLLQGTHGTSAFVVGIRHVGIRHDPG